MGGYVAAHSTPSSRSASMSGSGGFGQCLVVPPGLVTFPLLVVWLGGMVLRLGRARVGGGLAACLWVAVLSGSKLGDQAVSDVVTGDQVQ
jgi:hypothetical protein